MTELSIAVEGTSGLNWPRWKKLVEVPDELGFDGLYLSDHFTTPVPPYPDSLEMIVALAYLADHGQHVRFGPLVAPLSLRDPVMLARQAIALDNLSGGRMVLGVGAGWMEREHEMFGYELGDVRTRLDRLEEGLEVISRLLRSEEPVSYEGRFYRLHEAMLRPGPERPGGPPILVGASGPKRALPLVARYADIWDGQNISPDDYRKRSSQLDELLVSAGRRPGDVKRTFTTKLLCGRNSAELDASPWRRFPPVAHLPFDATVQVLRSIFPTMIIGSPENVVEEIQKYSAAGVQEMIIQWAAWDIEGLHLVAEEVMPYLRS